MPPALPTPHRLNERPDTVTEYGLFNDEGCVEAQFYSVEAARGALASYSQEDELRVLEMCPDHLDELEARDHCELCAEDE